jgi:catechol 2,3-dioxygenase
MPLLHDVAHLGHAELLTPEAHRVGHVRHPPHRPARAQKSYDLVYTDDWTKSSGRLHHLAFATDTREDILRAADICLDKSVFIETGPHKHAIQQTFFLYVYEPGGNRIDPCNPCARLIFAPDWAPISWTEQERAKGQAWGLATIGSFHTHGTPPVG